MLFFNLIYIKEIINFDILLFMLFLLYRYYLSCWLEFLMMLLIFLNFVIIGMIWY